MTTSREIRLIARPPGTLPVPGELLMTEVEVRAPRPGEAVVRNLYMAIDPGLLMRMQDVEPPEVPDYELGQVPWGHALGEVVESASPALRPGDVVLHSLAWREYAVAEAAEFRVVDRDLYPSLTHHLSSAVVAYVGLRQIDVRPGDTVVVSSAAGAVGGMAGQLARVRGAGRVIGSVGSAEKAEFVVKELGFDAAFDYHEGWPDLGGVDVYYDNVGGRQLEAAVSAMNVHGRIVLCGWTEQLRTGSRHSVQNMDLVVERRLTLRGFTTDDHRDLFPLFEEEFPALVASGRVVVRETIIEGLGQLVPAARAQLEGAYRGKVLLRF
ncbi:zinc-binding dehydrogenase [Streptomyces sp. NPDC007088]|uniref:zinc-binding dehydrogenase n=1 Tax=Streptomyces sp. NPDC007088 TaxID=3364773 RepID=UPI00367C4FE1